MARIDINKLPPKARAAAQAQIPQTVELTKKRRRSNKTEGPSPWGGTRESYLYDSALEARRAIVTSLRFSLHDVGDAWWPHPQFLTTAGPYAADFLWRDFTDGIIHVEDVKAGWRGERLTEARRGLQALKNQYPAWVVSIVTWKEDQHAWEHECFEVTQ